jgi:hypothetical protein
MSDHSSPQANFSLLLVLLFHKLLAALLALTLFLLGSRGLASEVAAHLREDVASRPGVAVVVWARGRHRE